VLDQPACRRKSSLNVSVHGLARIPRVSAPRFRRGHRCPGVRVLHGQQVLEHVVGQAATKNPRRPGRCERAGRLQRTCRFGPAAGRGNPVERVGGEGRLTRTARPPAPPARPLRTTSGGTRNPSGGRGTTRPPGGGRPSEAHHAGARSVSTIRPWEPCSSRGGTCADRPGRRTAARPPGGPGGGP
jgi:hypothetical protein